MKKDLELIDEIDSLIAYLQNMGETLYSNDDEIDTDVIVNVLSKCKKVIEE